MNLEARETRLWAGLKALPEVYLDRVLAIANALSFTAQSRGKNSPDKNKEQAGNISYKAALKRGKEGVWAGNGLSRT